jgi:hypothetical protein
MIAEVSLLCNKWSHYFGIIGCSGAFSFLLLTSATPNSLMSLAAVCCAKILISARSALQPRGGRSPQNACFPAIGGAPIRLKV